MSENDNKEVEVKEVDSNQQEETKIDLNEFKAMQDELARMKTFHNKILEEKKQEEQKRKDAEAAAKEIAEKEGNLKELLNITKKEFEEKLNAANETINSFKKQEEDRKVAKEAQKIANELAKSDTRRAGLLAEKIKEHLKLTEDGVKVVDPSTKKLTTDNFESLTLKMKKDYDFLCDAVDSSGSGAKQVVSGNVVKNFKDMTEAEQVALYRANPQKWKELREKS